MGVHAAAGAAKVTGDGWAVKRPWASAAAYNGSSTRNHHGVPPVMLLN
ncbi:hypothetical protein [Actinacidiphila soli]|nr:hypothetical protein [Actinacidiphila soli]